MMINGTTISDITPTLPQQCSSYLPQITPNQQMDCVLPIVIPLLNSQVDIQEVVFLARGPWDPGDFREILILAGYMFFFEDLD